MKTTFKLAAVALALMASGAIAAAPGVTLPYQPEPTRPPLFTPPTGPVPVIVPHEFRWDISQAAADRTVSASVTNKYGNSDIAVNHRQGWKGQGILIVTNSASLSAAVQTIAPNAWVYDRAISDSHHSGAAYTGDVAFGYKGILNLVNADHSPYLGTWGARGFQAQSKASGGFTVSSVYINQGNGAFGTSSHSNYGDVSFDLRDVNTGNAAANARLTNKDKVAYLAGSAAIIHSKFMNLEGNEVVTYMGQSSTNGVFRLGTSLSPRNPVR